MSDIAKMRAALKPFVTWLNHVSATQSRRLADNEYPPVSGMPSMGELRAARAALTGTEHERLIADLLTLVKRYASECAECNGTGEVTRHFVDSGGCDLTQKGLCIDCADIRALIATAESHS